MYREKVRRKNMGECILFGLVLFFLKVSILSVSAADLLSGDDFVFKGRGCSGGCSMDRVMNEPDRGDAPLRIDIGSLSFLKKPADLDRRSSLEPLQMIFMYYMRPVSEVFFSGKEWLDFAQNAKYLDYINDLAMALLNAPPLSKGDNLFETIGLKLGTKNKEVKILLLWKAAALGSFEAAYSLSHYRDYMPYFIQETQERDHLRFLLLLHASQKIPRASAMLATVMLKGGYGAPVICFDALLQNTIRGIQTNKREAIDVKSKEESKTAKKGDA